MRAARRAALGRELASLEAEHASLRAETGPASRRAMGATGRRRRRHGLNILDVLDGRQGGRGPLGHTGLGGGGSYTRLSGRGGPQSALVGAAHDAEASTRVVYARWKPLKELNGHQNETVFCVSFDPSGRIVVTGADDGLVKIWSAHSMRLLHTVRGHTGCVRSPASSLCSVWVGVRVGVGA